MRFARYRTGLLALLLLPHGGAAQAPAGDFRSVASEFARRVVDAGELTIARMDLGRVARDTNRFTALVTNKSSSPRQLGVSLRAVPGLWLRGNWQRAYRFEIPANSEHVIEAAYVFRRMSPEATLHVAFGTPVDAPGGADVVERFYDTTLVVGGGNPAAIDPRPSFDTASTEHFEVFAWRGSPGARQMAAIAAGRERALQRIAEILAVSFSGRIRLILYPDSATKTGQTGHIGDGFASGRTIVEIFNDSVQLDPYHEVAHIVAGVRGSPPALLDEGFAVYVAELLGADALRYLGAPGKTVAEVTCGYLRAGRLIPLGRLFRFSDIGSDSTAPSISYPEAASVTAFLIDRYGRERFRDAYARLKNTADPAELAGNERLMREIYGSGVEAMEAAWRAWLRCPTTSLGLPLGVDRRPPRGVERDHVVRLLRVAFHAG